MKLKVLPQEFSICRVEDIGDIDYSGKFIFISKTDKEISVVCESGKLPQAVVECKNGWKAVVTDEKHTNGTKRAAAEISRILSGSNIDVFIVSTYSEDYIFVKTSDTPKAIISLSAMGYEFM